jgi:polysaccharide export outer membrane protein
LKSRMIFLCAAILLGFCEARAQQPAQEKDNGREPQVQDKALAQRGVARPAREAGDLVGDNLDRVAATAEQILEALGRDAGLMVEFQSMLARYASAGGQLLEESDLTESAVAERLREDLRTRVLATRLLQRYGYLVPKINPDSDLAQEQKLFLQERAQQLVRARERNDAGREALPGEITAACDLQQWMDCEGQESARQRARTLSVPRGKEGLPAEETPEREEYPGQRARPDGGNSPQVLRTEFREPGSSEPMLASSTPGGNSAGNFSSPVRGSAGIAPEGPFSRGMSGNELPRDGNAVEERTGNGGGSRAGANEFERRFAGRGATERTAREFESAHMVRRPNPYADAPSLYDLYVQASWPTQEATRFGAELFRHGAVNADVLPMDLPVGPDYVLGPGDSLSIDLWGGVSQRLFRVVDREGRLLLPEAGPLLVAGKALGDVQEAVQRVLRTQFRDVSADVSLLKLRTVRVYVVGEVTAPGAYDISSLSTPLNALFAAGGVTGRGSLRRLEHYRGKQLLEEVDAYDLLLHGIRGEVKRLENGDSLRVPPLGSSVTVQGMVRRPGQYELRAEKNLGEALDLAGGILPAAALRHIEVQRLDAHEKRTMLSLEMGEESDKEALRAQFEKFHVQDGDEIHIFPIAPYNTGAVYLEGHVLRPGRYSYHDGMKLSDLVSSYKELLPEPAERYGEIIRIAGPEKRPVIESFNLAAALEHPESAPKLHALDTVRIFGRYDLEASPEFTVLGEVRNPGRYRSSGQAHLRDAIYQAGGETSEAWNETVQLFRSMPDSSTKVFSISLREALAGDPLNNIRIEPRDRILVHRQPEKVSPRSVYVRGDVARPGRYPLAANMRVSDLVLSAGGLLRSANPASGDLTHYAATSGATAAQESVESQAVNLTAALEGKENENFSLRDGDVLTVPQQTGWKNIGASVTLRGEVGKPGVYGIQPGERLSSLLRRAGGLLPTSYAQAAVFERVDVRQMQQKSRQEQIQRMEQESVVVRSAVTASGTEEAALQQAAMQQRQRMIEALRRAPVSGRLVVHIREGQKGFAGSPDDIELRAGDTLEIPKQPGFVVIVGQVYNANAISYAPGKNAGWYLSHAGGATGLANKKAIFIIRANGSVISGGSGLVSGGVLSSSVGPGDTIVVPEKAAFGSNTWKNVVAIAQIAQAAALAAAVAIP